VLWPPRRRLCPYTVWEGSYHATSLPCTCRALHWNLLRSLWVSAGACGAANGSTSRRRQRWRSAYRRRAVEHASLRRQAGVMRTSVRMGFRPRSRWCLMQYCAPEPSLLHRAFVLQPSCWHCARCNRAYCQMSVPSQRGRASLRPERATVCCRKHTHLLRWMASVRRTCCFWRGDQCQRARDG
jgi:hypothetical protein